MILFYFDLITNFMSRSDEKYYVERINIHKVRF